MWQWCVTLGLILDDRRLFRHGHSISKCLASKRPNSIADSLTLVNANHVQIATPSEASDSPPTSTSKNLISEKPQQAHLVSQ